MLEYGSHIALVADAKGRLLAVARDGTLAPTTDQRAGRLRIHRAADLAWRGRVSFGDVVVFDAPATDPRQVGHRSLRYRVKGTHPKQTGAVPIAGDVILSLVDVPPNKALAKAQSAIGAYLKLLAKPAPAPAPSPPDDDADTVGGEPSSGSTDATSGSGTGDATTGGSTNDATTGGSTTGGSSGGGDDDVPFLGEIRLFACLRPPRGWLLCEGQTLVVSEHSALFSVIGTTYGGEAPYTFRLPDLRGRLAMHAGDGPGVSARTRGESGGSENVTIEPTTMPTHAHAIHGLAFSDKLAPTDAPTADLNEAGRLVVSGTGDPPLTTAATGNQQAHSIMPPYLVVNFMICTQGVYPTSA